MQFSKFGKRFSAHDGARQLMDDLGMAMASDSDVMMLGGGNPAHIPQVLERIADILRDVASDPRELRRMVADYSAPAGEERYRVALAKLFADRYGWPIGAQNVALTGGSQTGFFQLFNLLAGEFDDGSFRRILLPLTPEYLGYPVVGSGEEQFVSNKPNIEYLDDRQFKYHIDFESLSIDDSIAAICVSRPTNPTGNVLTAEELAHLQTLARDHEIPLIVDNAYGAPFPQIVFADAEPIWDENTIICMSLSKIGLPAVRTGIIIAAERVIDAIAGMNAAMSLAVSSVGPVLMRKMIESGEIVALSRDVIRPFYRERMKNTVAWLHQALNGVEYFIHRPEGAFFLWVWFPELQVTSQSLYEKLKARGVYVLSGHYFFPGLKEDWPHRQQCIRISYSQDLDAVQRAIGIIGDVVKQVS